MERYLAPEQENICKRASESRSTGGGEEWADLYTFVIDYNKKSSFHDLILNLITTNFGLRHKINFKSTMGIHF